MSRKGLIHPSSIILFPGILAFDEEREESCSTTKITAYETEKNANDRSRNGSNQQPNGFRSNNFRDR